MGAYGANAVHFSMIQEYVAGMLGVEVGEYSQVTDCMHLYLDNPNWESIKKESERGTLMHDPYSISQVTPYPMIEDDKDVWDHDLQLFCMAGTGGKYYSAFFNDVAVPILKVWAEHKRSREGLNYIDYIAADDWRLAIARWLTARYV